MHRDLKPDNLMVDNQGVLKHIDFGMAKNYGEDLMHSKNQITLAYRPPEILFGASHYGPAADMWSIGCIFGELHIRFPLFPG
mmetsp:Transcript_66170/g.91576  ORF Transcript_66170/g.91576 Transcript_66170/m.91576 type:complete len:82 (-) Transcript_66170:361-606(-)